MERNDSFSFVRFIFKARLFLLLVFILMLIAIQPLEKVMGELEILLDLVTTAILISAIFAISQKKSNAVAGALIAIPMFLSIWLDHFLKKQWIITFSSICGIVFFVFIIVVILKFIFSRDEVNKDLIAGAAVVYLMIAVVWTFIYRTIETINPGSFSIAESQSLDPSAPFLYYSFVTITTLGYGDIFPVSSAAKSAAILEALIGQLFLVILVAWLVGVHISQSMDKKSRRSTKLNSGDD